MSMSLNPLRLFLMRDGSVDTSFPAVWPRSACKYLEIIENIVYAHSPTDDAVIRMGIKNSKEASELLAFYNPFKT